MKDKRAYLLKRGWTEQIEGNAPNWNDPLEKRNWCYLSIAVAIQQERDAERLDTVMAENDTLRKAALALLACIEADNRIKRGDYYHERKAVKAALKGGE